MEAMLRSVWNWAVTQFNYAIGGIKWLWNKLLNFLTFIKDSIVSLMSSLKARFCHTSETATVTRSTSVPSTPEGEFTERVEVHQRRTEFEFEFGNPPAKRRQHTQESQEDQEKEIKVIEDTSNLLSNLADVMKQDLRASTTEEAEKTASRVKDLLESDETEKLITGLRRANLSLV